MAQPPNIAHYRITGKLGEGGMGEVWRATDTKLNREVAIKVLPAVFSQDSDRMARFQREALVLASLNHPNIAAIYGVEELALVMELVEGEDLRGPLPLETALAYARQIADALEAAHEKGVVHRDLKPDNIKVRPDGTVKVLDFGLAKSAGQPQDDSRNSPTLTMRSTQPGVVMGTAAYMAPEQARGQTVDRRADIWAFGVVLFEMLTGRQLFSGPTASDTLAAILKTEPDLSGLPAQIRPVVERCLRKDPRRRWQAIGDVRLALEEGPLTEPAPEAARTQRAILPWAIAGALLLVAALGWWRASRTEPSPSDRPLVRLDVDLGIEENPRADIAASPAAISPDGSRVVFPMRLSGQSMLAQRALSKAQTDPIPGTENGYDPFFSPDGQSIAFFADQKLKRVSLNGGVPITLADASLSRGGTWVQDGVIVAALSNSDGLYRISASGGTPPQLLTKLMNREATHRWPQALPGGLVVVFTVSGNRSFYEDASVEAVILETGERKVLHRGGYYGRYAASGHLLYVSNNVVYALPFDASGLAVRGTPAAVLPDSSVRASSATGSFALSDTGTLVYRSGKPEQETWMLAAIERGGKRRVQERLSAPGWYFNPRFSPDGKRMAIGVETNGADIYLYDLATGGLMRLTFTSDLDWSPAWPPDGRHLLVEKTNGRSGELHWVRADGSGAPKKIFEFSGDLEPAAFAPDGRTLAYVEASNGASHIGLLPVEGADGDDPKVGAPRQFPAGSGNQLQPAISPDGRWIAYASDETKSWEIYVQPFPETGGGRWQVSTNGGTQPVWSRARQELLYENPRKQIVVAKYAVSGSTFQAQTAELWSNDVTLTPTANGDFDLSPDGKVVEALVAAPSASDPRQMRVTFLLNFFDELRRQTRQ